MLTVKLHQAEDRKLLAITDTSLLGKTFTEGNLQLDFTKQFYKGEDKDPAVDADRSYLLDLLRQECIVQASGTEAVQFLEGLGLVEQGHVLTVGGIPTVQVVLVA